MRFVVYFGLAALTLSTAAHADTLVCFTDDQARAQLAMNEAALKAVGEPAADTYIVLRNLIKSAQGKPCPKVPEPAPTNPPGAPK